MLGLKKWSVFACPLSLEPNTETKTLEWLCATKEKKTKKFRPTWKYNSSKGPVSVFASLGIQRPQNTKELTTKYHMCTLLIVVPRERSN